MPPTMRRLVFAALGLTLLPAALAAQNIVADPVSLVFTYKIGGALPGPRVLGVGLDTGGSAPYTVTAGVGEWLSVAPSTGTTPDTVQVSVHPLGLDSGVYSGQVRIDSGGRIFVVPVTLYVQEIFTDLVVSPGQLFFEAIPNGAAPPAQLISVSAPPTQLKPFSVFTSGDGWLLASPTNALTPSTVEVQVEQRNVLPGAYQGAVNFLDSEGRLAWTVLVTMVVAQPSPVTAAPAALSFQAKSGVDSPQSKNVVITSVTGDSHLIETRAATDSGGGWLSVSPAASITPTVIAITVNGAGLPVGTYRGAVILTVLKRAVTIPVTLTITGGPALAVSSDFLRFLSGEGAAPNPQSLVVDSLSGSAVPFVVATSGEEWLAVTPESGTTLATLTVSARPAGLTPGVYNALISITAAGSAVPTTVQVSFEITDVVTVQAEPTVLSFAAAVGSTSITNKPVTVSSSGPPLAFTVTAASAGWLAAAQTANSTPARIAVSANPASLATGIYHGSVVIHAPAAGNSPLSIPVTLEVEGSVPRISAVVHGASLTAGSVAPGTTVTLYGQNLGPEEGSGLVIGSDGRVTTALAGVRVLFDGIPGALLYVQARQVNVVVPYALAGLRSANVVGEYMGEQSPTVQLTLSPAAPGIFTVDSSGQGPGAILNQDYSLNHAGNPAAPGEIVIIYGTGAGQTSPPGVDGEIVGPDPPRPLAPVKVWIGGAEAALEYAGGAPGFVAGVLQVNARVPQSLRPGAHPIFLEIGQLRSQLAVTVAVR